MTGLGFTEIMSLDLQSEESHFTKLRMEPGDSYVRVDNPKTINQRVLRSHLVTGLIDTLEMIEGDLPNRARKLVLEWASLNKNELKKMWDLQEYHKLPPLE